MITVIVQYRLPATIDLAACAEHFRAIAPGFRQVHGLIRKQFIYAEDGWAGGVYLWRNRADAEAFYSGPWLQGIRERYGMDPEIRYFHTAAVTDNSTEACCCPKRRNRHKKPLRKEMIAICRNCATLTHHRWRDGPSSPAVRERSFELDLL